MWWRCSRLFAGYNPRIQPSITLFRIRLSDLQGMLISYFELWLSNNINRVVLNQIIFWNHFGCIVAMQFAKLILKNLVDHSVCCTQIHIHALHSIKEVCEYCFLNSHFWKIKSNVVYLQQVRFYHVYIFFNSIEN